MVNIINDSAGWPAVPLEPNRRQHQQHDEYGRSLLAYLSERLTTEFGKGFTERNLRAMRQFYEAFPIRHTLRAELSWSHYRLLMRVEEPSRREFYLNESADSGWTSRQLERQINSFFY